MRRAAKTLSLFISLMTLSPLSTGASARDENEIDRLLASPPVWSARGSGPDSEICVGLALSHGMWPTVLHSADRSIVMGVYEAQTSTEWIFYEIAVEITRDGASVRVINPKVWTKYEQSIKKCFASRPSAN
jgi:hypothetical protein